VLEWFRLDGRAAVVTGGAGGLGEAIASGFARAGAAVVIADRNLEAAAEVAARCSENAEAVALPVEVTDRASLRELLSATLAHFGRVDILVNSAGISARHAAEDFPEEDWDRVIGVNLKGLFLACQTFGCRMLEQRSGSIINLASIAGGAGIPGTTAYCQSKGGVVQLTRSLAVEWADRGVRVNALAPSIFDTPLLRAADQVNNAGSRWMLARTPIGRYGQPREIVGPAVFLASEAAAMVTGAILPVDGGFLAA
jgi:NAD(P)-dependent dehydrogenase (short-subunit alcohol dehydrogenase family)